MRRSQLLAVTGLTQGAFAMMSKRGMLPTSGGKAGGNWNAYSSDDAFRVALTLLFASQGVKQMSARALVSSEYEALLDQASEGEGAGPFFFAHVTIEGGRRDLDEARSSRVEGVVASEDGLSTAISDRRREAAKAGCALVAFVAVNVTAAAKSIIERADEAGVVDDRLLELGRLFRAI